MFTEGIGVDALRLFATVVNSLMVAETTAHDRMSSRLSLAQQLKNREQIRRAEALRELLREEIVMIYHEFPEQLIILVKDTTLPVDLRAAAAYFLPFTIDAADRAMLLSVLDPNAPVGDVQIRFQFVAGLLQAGYTIEAERYRTDLSPLIRTLFEDT